MILKIFSSLQKEEVEKPDLMVRIMEAGMLPQIIEAVDINPEEYKRVT